MYFDHTAMLGGGEIALLNLISNLDREVVRPLVVLCSDGPLAEALRPIAEVKVLELSDEIRRAKKDGLGFASFLRVKQLLQVAHYINKLRRLIRQNEIDIVHTNSLKSDIIGGLAARLAFTPVVWHLRDRIEKDYLPNSVVRVFRLLAKILPTIVIAISQGVLKTLDLKSERAVVVHDGTNLPPLFEEPVNKQYLRVGLIGRICPWKGQDIFLKAAAIVKTTLPDIRFQIVGSAMFDEQEYERRIRALCTSLRLDDVVTFAGFRPDIDAVLHNLDVVVHASTLGEPFGQVIVEGMAAAKPVIATNGGGVPEIVVNGETGLIVPMSDPSAMADAICQLLKNPELRLEMGRKGRERVRSHFTLNRTAQGVQAVYAKIQAAHSSHKTTSALPSHSLFRKA
jgi:glycosyltransferase involved in cell wall biosynthesis